MHTEEHKKAGELKYVAVSAIRENNETEILRQVDETDEKFLGLMESIKKDGIINPISLREVRNPANPDIPLYGLVDGRHRFTAARILGMQEVPALVRSVEDGDVLASQILANVHKIETKPMQYTEALKALLRNDPMLTMAELASRLSKSPTWLSERLQLTNIEDEKVASLIDEGSIKLVNAYALAKLPADKQVEYLDMARSLSPTEFVPKINKVIKELKTAKREGRAPVTTYIAAPYLQKIGDISNEVDNPVHVPALLASENITNPIEIVKMALKWAIHMDPASIRMDAAEWETKKEMAKKKAEERKLEREKLKQEQEARKAADVTQL